MSKLWFDLTNNYPLVRHVTKEFNYIKIDSARVCIPVAG